MNVLRKLAYDHDKIIKLIRDIENLGHKKSQLRKPLFQLLEKQLLILNKAEENTFYEELERNFKTRKLVTKLKKQNEDITNWISKLHHDELNSKEWHKDFNQFKELVFNHIDIEEEKLFPAADKVLSEQKEKILGDDLSEEKQNQWDVEVQGSNVSIKEDFGQNVRVA